MTKHLATKRMSAMQVAGSLLIVATLLWSINELRIVWTSFQELSQFELVIESTLAAPLEQTGNLNKNAVSDYRARLRDRGLVSLVVLLLGILGGAVMVWRSGMRRPTHDPRNRIFDNEQ